MLTFSTPSNTFIASFSTVVAKASMSFEINPMSFSIVRPTDNASFQTVDTSETTADSVFVNGSVKLDFKLLSRLLSVDFLNAFGGDLD